MPRDTLTVVDERTGRRYELPIEDGAIRAGDLAQITLEPGRPGLISYDPALGNTATCRSAISTIDAHQGFLRYRGYRIEELVEHSTFLEVAYLIVKGELPTASHFRMWKHNVITHTMTHENIKRFITGFRYDAHPMGILVATVAALSTFYPDAKNILDIESRRMQTRRLIGKMPTIAAFAYRHLQGLPQVYPDNDLSYTGNFLSMMFRMTELKYVPNPVLERALEVLFILHADDEQNCSTSAMRMVGSAHADPYAAVAAATAALGGRRHGAANADVVQMLREIGSADRIPAFLKEVRTGGRPLFGFGHGVYTRGDPRAKILRTIARQIFEVTGKTPLADVALELERIALEDEDFAAHGLFPNVDFYSGIIYDAMGFPVPMFPVLLAIGRTAGWMAHWAELVIDPDQKMARPRQLYAGVPERPYVPLSERQDGGALETEVTGPL